MNTLQILRIIRTLATHAFHAKGSARLHRIAEKILDILIQNDINEN